MSLQLVTGASGAGKSHTLYEELIRESMEHPERNYLVLVPEQFTMQTQADLVRRSPRKGLLNVDVLSFNRLAHRVFEEVGGTRRPILDDMGKTLVVQRVIAEKQKDLGVLGRTLMQRGSASQMKSLISELLAYRVEPAELSDWAELASGRGLLPGKLADVQEVYQGFCDYLADRYLTAEEVLQVLCPLLPQSELIRGSRVVLDGFTGFTPAQHEVIRELLSLCSEITAVITVDEGEDLMQRGGEHRLFHMSREMAQKLVRLAHEAGTEILPVRRIAPGGKSRFAGNPELAFLERHLFRYDRAVFAGENTEAETAASRAGSAVPDVPAETALSGAPAGPETAAAGTSAGPEIGDAAPGHAITVIEAADPAEEVRYAAETIRRLVREEGWLYRDFALVTGDIDTYGRLAEECFAGAGIPFFLDSRKPVWTNALVEYIRSAVDMLIHRFSYESVFRFLRCGFSPLTEEETDRLENYVLALGIRGRSRYEEKWIRRSRRTTAEELEALNALRERFVEATAALTEGFRRKSPTVAGKTETLYRFLAAGALQERCEAVREAAEARGDAAAAGEYAQIFPRVIDLLDKLVEVLGDEKISMAGYQQLLEAGFTELRLGLIPPGEDQVLVGDIERTRLKHIRCLFFAGVNDGTIPRPVSSKGILSDADREFLQSRDIELSPTARQEICRQRFYLYLNMTKPSDRLFLSYSTTDESGAALLPSYLIGTIRKLFPEVSVTRPEEAGRLNILETSAGRREVLLAGLRGDEAKRDGVFLELYRDMERTEDGREEIGRLLRAAAVSNHGEKLGAAVARALYGNGIRGNTSRLEKFAACAFAHFVQYGLRPAEREQYEFLPVDLGIIMHSALERFSGKLREADLVWAELSDAERETLVGSSVDDVVFEYGNTILQSSNRNRYQIERIRRVLRRTVWALQQQIRRGSFAPAKFETAFLESAGTDKNGNELLLTGRIDRLDLCERDGRRFVKVIDYKTGQTSFDINLLYEGLQLQLALYLDAAVEQERKRRPERAAEPAGMYYYHIDDPLIDPVPEEKREESILKELRLDGISRQEEDVLRLLDGNLAAGSGSDVIKVKLNKDGTASADSRVAGKETFDLICAYTRGKAAELAGRILEGETAAAPYAAKDRTACTWCPYKDICGFDQRIPGFGCRRLPERDMDDVLKAMREGVRENDGTAGASPAGTGSEMAPQAAGGGEEA